MSVWNWVSEGLTAHPPDDTNMKQGWNDINRGKTEELGSKPVPLPICPPQTLHGPTSAVRCRRLTASAAIGLCINALLIEVLNVT